MRLNLEGWKKDWSLMQQLFTEDEIKKITARLKKMTIQNVVFCSFENRFAKSGGLAAVTVNILSYLKEINNIPQVCLMTPFYSRIINKSKVKKTDRSFSVTYNGKSVKVEILKYNWEYTKPTTGTIKEYYLKADGFFESQNRLHDPYIYFENEKQQNDEAITENALFFCKAVPLALKELDISENTVFHLQEWQTALISLTAKEAMLNGTLTSCGTVQTMHNPFDSFISWELLERIIDKKQIQRISQNFTWGLTAYQIGLLLVDAPVTTVSENFANEFTSDILQTEHFAPHLQSIFKKNRVFGINNGMFISFPSEFSKKKSYTMTELKKIKSEKRKSLLKILDEYLPKERFGELTYKGGSITKLPDEIPIVVMSGRLDFNQKGYDILLNALKKFAADEIKAILTPMPVKQSDLDYFYEIAEECKGNITVFPIRMEKGFQELQIGCTYGIMPSIYEPFGAAVEYMVNGTVNIARATGGLVDQIEDRKNGILFKEVSGFFNLENIKQFSESSDNVHKRKSNNWVQSMVDELYSTLIEAIDLYQNHQQNYFKMITQGFKKASTFNWDICAKKYFAVFKKVKSGF